MSTVILRCVWFEAGRWDLLHVIPFLCPYSCQLSALYYVIRAKILKIKWLIKIRTGAYKFLHKRLLSHLLLTLPYHAAFDTYTSNISHSSLFTWSIVRCYSRKCTGVINIINDNQRGSSWYYACWLTDLWWYTGGACQTPGFWTRTPGQPTHFCNVYVDHLNWLLFPPLRSGISVLMASSQSLPLCE